MTVPHHSRSHSHYQHPLPPTSSSSTTSEAATSSLSTSAHSSSSSAATAAAASVGGTIGASQRHSNSNSNSHSTSHPQPHTRHPSPSPTTTNPLTSQSTNPHYARPMASFYPMPYPLSYPPSFPPVRPAAQLWSAARPHRYVVCRHCDTILLCLVNLPTSVQVTRHFADDVPISMTQDFLNPNGGNERNRRIPVHQADALMWLRRPFAGMFRYDASHDRTKSHISLACRTCGQTNARALVILSLNERRRTKHSRKVERASERGGEGEGEGEGGNEKCRVCVTFEKWCVTLSDAYGRNICAAAEARGFWNCTPASTAGRPMSMMTMPPR